MSDGEFELDDWIFGLPGEQRFTQDSPVLPEVWRSYGEEPGKPQDLLLTPHKDSSAADLLAALPTKRVARKKMGLAYNDGYVVATLDFRQLVRQVVPLSHWWSLVLPPEGGRLDLWVKSVRGFDDLVPPVAQKRDRSFRPDLLAWYLALVGRVELGKAKAKAGSSKKAGDRLRQWRRFALAGAGVLKAPVPPAPERAPLWTVSVNRTARTALSRSRLAVKADAAERVFAIGCGELRLGGGRHRCRRHPPGLPPSQRKRRARARSGRGPRRLLPRPRHLRLHPVCARLSPARATASNPKSAKRSRIGSTTGGRSTGASSSRCSASRTTAPTRRRVTVTAPTSPESSAPTGG